MGVEKHIGMILKQVTLIVTSYAALVSTTALFFVKETYQEHKTLISKVDHIQRDVAVLKDRAGIPYSNNNHDKKTCKKKVS